MEICAVQPAQQNACRALGVAKATHVLCKEGEVIGAACVCGAVCTALAVAPAWRRKGYGTYFLKQLLRCMARPAQGQPGLLCCMPEACVPAVEVPAQHKALCALCEKLGLVAEVHRPEFGGVECPATAEGPDGLENAHGPRLLRYTRPVPAASAAVQAAHAFLARHVAAGATALDATAGNGHDALFLARLVGPQGHVTALDIQPQAVDATNARLAAAGCAAFARCVCDSHAHLARYCAPGRLDAAVFNLGYLPGAAHGVFTEEHTSVPAMRAALECLRPGGVLTACLYSGGAQGTHERCAALCMFRALPVDTFTVETPACAFDGAPQAVLVQKR